MLHLRNINPMVRAVGTMGAVSALVGGITFAQLTSNTVALSPNTLSTGSANLRIGTASNTGNNNGGNNGGNDNGGNNNDNDGANGGNDTSGTSTANNTNNPVSGTSTVNTNNDNSNMTCTRTTNGTIPGFNLTGAKGLLPGVQSNALSFCLKNASNVPLSLTAVIPDDPFTNTTGLKSSDVTLAITCDNGGHVSATLDKYLSTATPVKMLGSLAANGTATCQATVELSNTATITGTESLPSFDIEFTGTTSS